jgi:CheY-like chemotaxis protein
MSLVLIVEDEDALRVLAEPVIQHHGYEALSAGALEQAIALLEGDQKSDRLFTDLGLPDDLHSTNCAREQKRL